MVSLSIEFLGSGKKMNPVETEALGAAFMAITSRIQAKRGIQRSDSSSGQSSSGGPYGGGR